MSRRTWKARIEWTALCVAVLLVSGPSALLVPARAAATPARETAPAAPTEVAQLEPGDQDPGNQDPGTDPGDDSGDDDVDQDPSDVGTPNPLDQPPGKVYPVQPDSLLKAKTTPPPAGGAPMDTLRAVTPGAASARRPSPGATAPQHRTILGLHPAIFIAGLVALHVFVVKAVDE